MHPPVSEVVDVLQVPADESFDGSLLAHGVRLPVRILVRSDGCLRALDLEHVHVSLSPSHRRLDDLAQVQEVDVGGDGDGADNLRLHILEDDLQEMHRGLGDTLRSGTIA